MKSRCVTLMLVNTIVLLAWLPADAATCSSACCSEKKTTTEFGFASDTEENPSPLACNLLGLSEEQRERRVEIWKDLTPQVLEVREMLAGYAFRFDTTSEILMQIAELVTLEARCCPFLRFDVEITEEGGPIWFELSGRDGVKEFLDAIMAKEGSF
jgi:hypothetical protein